MDGLGNSECLESSGWIGGSGKKGGRERAREGGGTRTD